MDNRYIPSNLNDTDFASVCNIIGADAFKTYYHEYSHLLDFSGQESPSSEITNEQAIGIAIQNRKNTYILAFIDSKIKKSLREIQETVDKHESAGNRKDIAYAKAILLSPFKKQIDLYFRLSGIPLQSPLVKNVKAIVSRVISKSSNPKESQLPIRDNLPISSNLSPEEYSKKSYEDIIARYKKENADLNASLLKCKEQIHGLEEYCKKMEDELRDLHQNNGNEIIEGVDFSDNNQHLSLCEITEPDSFGLKWLSRLADINKIGEIIPFVSDPNRPLNYQNRTKIYMRRNGEKRSSEPDLPGQIGIWHWDSSPSPDDPAKDYNTICFHNELSPIAIILLTECDTYKELIKYITSGIKAFTSSERLIVAIRQDNGNLLGLLLKSYQYISDSSGIKLKSDIITLPKYTFPEKDTVLLTKDRLYYKWLNITAPFETVPVKDPMEVVKQIVLSRSSWSVVKERTELKKSNWQTLRNLLLNIDNTSVIDDIQTKLGYTSDEARQMLDRFLSHVDRYADGVSVEDQWLLALLSVNDDLLSRCQDLIRDDWNKQNEALIRDAENRLKAIEDKAKEATGEYAEKIHALEEKLKETETACKEAKAEHEKILSDIKYALDLAAGVEERVANRIKAAQTDAASFVADMAFRFPDGFSKAQSALISNSEKASYRSGVSADSVSIEKFSSYSGAVSILSDCLEDAGISKDYCSSFASYLYSAYYSRYPILLAGPNSSEIADALSYALTGKSAGSMLCLGSYDEDVVNNSIQSEDSVVKILNPFNAEWITRLPEFLSNRDKFYIAVYPYTEDLQIEPKSLYNYFLPVLTELFIEKAASIPSCAGMRNQTYKDVEITSIKTVKSFTKSGLKGSPLVINRIQDILSMADHIEHAMNQDIDVLFALLPYAFVTMQTPPLLDGIGTDTSSKLSVSKALYDLIQSQYGESV